ncbi:MAG: cold shock domain-containing protein [Gemmatimonas sp.]
MLAISLLPHRGHCVAGAAESLTPSVPQLRWRLCDLFLSLHFVPRSSTRPVVPREPIAVEGNMQGRIKWFDHEKGFGFVTPVDGSADAFVHESELSPTDLIALADGDAVEFETIAARLGPAAVSVRRIGQASPDVAMGSTGPVRIEETRVEASSDALAMLSHSERATLCVDGMSEEQKRTLFRWGMRMFSLGQHRVACIEAIKYDGQVIVLDDGSRWVVDSSDHATASIWSELDRVVVIDGEMFRLDEQEMIHIEEES